MSIIVVILTLIIIMSISTSAENWPQWRGPFLNGTTSEKDLPFTWSKTENVLWVAKMPGIGQSTPIIWKDRVFISAVEKDSKKIWALCLSASDGKTLWSHDIGTGFIVRNGNSSASPSPICDGERVYFLFSQGNLVAYDMDGQPVWQRDIEQDHGRIQIMFRYGASLLLYKDKLYMSVLHRHNKIEPEPGKPQPISYLLCIDPKTGKDLWKHERKTDAENESMEAYNTPYPFEEPNGTKIIVAGADYVTAHDPNTGEEVWRWGNLNPERRNNYRLVTSVVSTDNMLFFSEPRGQALFALEGGKSGELSEKDLAWSIYNNAPDVCTPLVMDGKLFVLDGDKRVMSCINPRTGDVIWTGNIETNTIFQASPTGADGKIYCISLEGEVVVLSGGDEFKVLSNIYMGEGDCRATISIANGRIFIRTAENLYCIGPNKK